MNMKLRAARDKSGMTQSQVAERSKVGERLYQDYEYGKREPGVRTAIRIADTLGVLDVRQLWGGNPIEEKPDGNRAK